MRKKVLALVLMCSMTITTGFSLVNLSHAASLDGNETIEKITASQIVNGKEDINEFELHTITYGKEDRVIVNEKEETGVIIPIYMPTKGDLYLNFTEEQISVNEGVIELYADKECTQQVGETIHYDDAEDIKEFQKRITVSKGAKTYYLAFYGDMPEDDSGIENPEKEEEPSEDRGNNEEEVPVEAEKEFTFRCYCVTSANRTLSSGEWIAIAYKSDENARYYKMRIEKDGHVLIRADRRLDISICGSDKGILYSQSSLGKENEYRASLFLKEGVYYIKTSGSTVKSQGVEKWARICYYFYPDGNSNYTVKTGNKYTVRPYSKATSCYYKYVATKTGYLRVTISSEQYNLITLCNEKKTPISSEKETGKVFGVRKGQTYYIRVRTTEEAYKNEIYSFTLKCTQTAISEKSGSKKSKATTIKAGKVYSGTIGAGQAEYDWYKFTLNTPQAVKLTIKTAVSGTLLVRVIDPSDVDMTSGGFEFKGPECAKLLESNGVWTAGTFYIQVLRKNKNSSGYYTLKWEV